MSSPCDRFRLAYKRHGAGGQPVMLLHGWPGDHTDYRHVVPLLGKDFDVVVPDLRGFGHSDKHRVDAGREYGAAAQARSIVALIDELDLRRPVVAGYDIGSRIAQSLAKDRPDVVKHLVVSPPLPGVGSRVLEPNAQRQFWYQAFHQLSLCEELIDGNRDAVRTYLRHFWAHWSGPAFTIADADLDHLLAVYSPPGALIASIGWYRAGAGTVATAPAEQPPRRDERISTPTSVLWPDDDPLFPRQWSDRLDDFFAGVHLSAVDGVGHFTPLECPKQFAELICRAAAAA
ncbi:alpha/beta fold hydrolase [Mycobacterium sp. E796]|uniref:alpha/beta fold hydrolase n=1 Tax=Mycobacterium sp. E796 TaxID=1834151 RepID=UPI0009EF67F0|nr:alpha/beta hydrolase [Mycobacterium sp. E796]